MSLSDPLEGLRVLELGTGIAAPYAGLLFAMLGATVVKGEPEGGDPARHHPIDDRPYETSVGPLYLHLNIGKRNVGIDRGGDPRDLEQAIAWADVVLDDRVASELRGTTLDPDRLRQGGAEVVLGSVTAWGFDAPEGAAALADELLVQAASGLMTLTGDPDGEPLRLPGWQTQYLAGSYTAAAVLAVLGSGGFKHVDVSWVASAATGAEGSFQRFLGTGRDIRPAGPHPPFAFPSGALPCADGYVVPGTIRSADWKAQLSMYGIAELEEDPRFESMRARAEHRDELWELIRPWYAANTKREIFERALELGSAMGIVMTPTDTLRDRHLLERSFCGEHNGPSGRFVSPCRLYLSEGSEPSAGRVHGSGEDGAWFDRQRRTTTASGGDTGPVLEGLRVLELTTAWAGPFVGRFLGAFGADVVKVEAPRSSDVWRMPPGPPELIFPDGEPGSRPFDRIPNFNGLNRNKRGICLDLASVAGRDAFLRLVSGADALVTNFSADALPRLGLTHEVLRGASPDLVLLSMPALGCEGAHRGAYGYGSIMEGLGGLASRFGYRDEGARVSQTFYPDAVAGIHGAVAVLSALAYRRRTGRGGRLDLSQQEALWLQLGEGIAFASLSGRNPHRMGNAEPGISPSGCYPTEDGAWIAIVVRTDEEFRRLVDVADPHLQEVSSWTPAERVERRGRVDELLGRWTCARASGDLEELLETAGVGVQVVHTYRTVFECGQDLFEEVEHPEAGCHPYLRIPVRSDGVPIRTRLPAPCFGEHTDEVLDSWGGLAPEEIANLRGRGIVRDAPGRA